MSYRNPYRFIDIAKSHLLEKDRQNEEFNMEVRRYNGRIKYARGGILTGIFIFGSSLLSLAFVTKSEYIKKNLYIPIVGVASGLVLAFGSEKIEDGAFDKLEEIGIDTRKKPRCLM